MKKPQQEIILSTLTEREQRIREDYEWCMHDPEMQKKYGGMVVVVHNRQVWGVGKNHAVAWKAAQRKRGCPERGYVAFVVVPYSLET